MDLPNALLVLAAFLLGAITMLGAWFRYSVRERWLQEQLAQKDEAILSLQKELTKTGMARDVEIEKREQGYKQALMAAQEQTEKAQQRADDLMSSLVTLTLELSKRKTEPKPATGPLYNKVKLTEAIAGQLTPSEIQMVASAVGIEIPEKATRTEMARLLVETAENRHVVIPLIEAAYRRNPALEIT